MSCFGGTLNQWVSTFSASHTAERNQAAPLRRKDHENRAGSGNRLFVRDWGHAGAANAKFELAPASPIDIARWRGRLQLLAAQDIQKGFRRGIPATVRARACPDLFLLPDPDEG